MTLEDIEMGNLYQSLIIEQQDHIHKTRKIVQDLEDKIKKISINKNSHLPYFLIRKRALKNELEIHRSVIESREHLKRMYELEFEQYPKVVTKDSILREEVTNHS